MEKIIGTKIYYCNSSGKVIKVIEDKVGFVRESTFDEDYENITEINDMSKDSVGLISVPYGEYQIISKGSTGVKVNLETKELEFSYDPLPEIPQDPNDIDAIKYKIDILEAENADLLLDSANKDIKLKSLEKDLADLTLVVGGI